MSTRSCLITAMALCANVASAGALPCTVVQNDLQKLGPDGASAPPQLLECVRTSRVCVLTFPEGTVIRANSVRELPTDGASSMGVVQSPADEDPGVCLVGTYSGGSAAAWVFDGWKVSAGRAVSVSGMDKSRMNSDSVPPRALGNAIAAAYGRASK
jgi:hypothetical protein